MKIIGWIRMGDKASCGGVVAEASVTEKCDGLGYAFQGAAMSCTKGCMIADGYTHAKLDNGKLRVHHGQCTSGGCALVSTVNNRDGIGNASGATVADQFVQDLEGKLVEVFLPRASELCEFDQHLVFVDEHGVLLEGLHYQLFDTRGALIAGVTGPDGKTEIITGDKGEHLSFTLERPEQA